VINSSSADPSDAVKDITAGLGSEAVIDFVNNTKTAPTSVNMLRKRGKLLVVGVVWRFPRYEFSNYSIKSIYFDRSVDWHIC
jgi:D-arabinose 1-dehydrogenase-like Zn-dependent alcohol dehydrogenase